MARLVLTTAEGIQTVDLAVQNSLGRHPSNSIQLLDKIVSKEHCTIERRESSFVLRDLGSLNGTFINGERVKGEQALRHGDEISLGSTRARFDDGMGLANFPMPAISPGAVPKHGTIPFQAQPNLVAGLSPQPPSNQVPSAQQPGPVSSQPAIRSALPSQGQQPPVRLGSNPGFPMPQQPMPPQVQQAPHVQSVRKPTLAGTRVDMLDSARAIERQIQARSQGFVPFDQVAADPAQLRLDYERLRLTWELAREISAERDLDTLLGKILKSLFKFVKADRGVILLKEPSGALQPRAAQRRDGTDAPIEVSSTILNHAIKERAAVITHDASSDFAASKGKSMILNRISSAMVVPLVHEQDVLGAVWLDSPALAQFQQKDLEVIVAVASQASMFIENTLLAKKIEQEIITRTRFSRLLSPNVAEQVMSGKLEIKKGGVNVPACTVFNSDIRGFTRMSEGTTAEIMVELLNDYFEQMVETIFKYDGTLDKFMGDGIMAFWGAPVHHPDDAIRSVSCALEQMTVLAKFNRRRQELGESPLAIGIGIHTGPLVAGYVGSSKALSYTVIGDTANTSARLCGVAATGQVLVSEATHALIESYFDFEELPSATLKGKEKPLRVFNVVRERVNSR
jgi:adenylate cyclase